MSEKNITFDVVWKRIKAHSGEEFFQIRGGKFTYQIKNEQVIPNRTNHQFSRSSFEEAFQLVPLPNTVPVQHLRGPSYIYAILMDERIRLGNW